MTVFDKIIITISPKGQQAAKQVVDQTAGAGAQKAQEEHDKREKEDSNDRNDDRWD